MGRDTSRGVIPVEAVSAVQILRGHDTAHACFSQLQERKSCVIFV